MLLDGIWQHRGVTRALSNDYTKKEVTMYSKISDDGRLFKKTLSIPKGKKIKVVKKTKNVAMIKYGDFTGYCKSRYVTAKKKKNYMV